MTSRDPSGSVLEPSISIQKIAVGGEVKRGLALFGRDVSVHYDGWQQPTRLNSNCIEINDVNYCLIATTLGIVGSFVMCKQKARYQQKAEYVRKAGQINANLLHVLTTIMTKADLYRCPHTGALYFLRASDGIR